MAFRQAENKTRIEGILSEIDLKYGSYVKNGETIETIGGHINVLVEHEVNGVATSEEIPVYMFSGKYTKAGKINPSYESIEKVMKEYVSIGACGSKAQADRVRITNAYIRMNEFVGQTGQIVSVPRVNASFVAKAVGDFKPEATFNLEFMVSSIARVVDNEGVEVTPAKLMVQVLVPQYTAPTATAMNVDLIPLYATSPAVIDAIENYWEAGMCYKASGRLNFTSQTIEKVEEVDFGEAQRTVRTISTNEFVITGGTQAPLDGDYAFDMDEIKAGMAARKARLEDMKNGKANQTKHAPAPTGTKGKQDLGF